VKSAEERKERISMENKKVGRYSFMAEPFQVDFSGRLPVSILGNQLLNAADFHSKERGFGIPTLRKENRTWVLSRLAVEMFEMPCQYEEYVIETWIESVFRFFTGRNFCVRSSNDGRVLAYARSVWAMIDLTTRKPIDLVSLYGTDFSGFLSPELPCPIGEPARIRVKEGKEVLKLAPVYSDIDINGHFNSIKYMEHVLNLFPLERFRDYAVRRFEVAYVAESYANDTLSFYLENPSENLFCAEIRKNASESVCRCRVEFEQKK
jgi:medium-chain acyl-[acyl-carrier-protein] hydrolase